MPADGPAVPGQSGAAAAAGAGLSVTVIFIAALSIPLATAAELGLSGTETTSWIVALYGLSAGASLILTARHRQPLILTGNIFVLFFVARLGGSVAWSELVGAAIVAGLAVLVLGGLGLTERLTEWLPTPIVYGLLAGVVLAFFVRMFDVLAQAPLLVGGTLAVYLLGRRFSEARLPAILPAMTFGLILAGLTGALEGEALTLRWPVPALAAPAFSVETILTVSPVMVLLITIQANVPSLVFLRNQGYPVPGKEIDAVSGLGTTIGSLMGPTGISLSLPATALCAGPDAGDPSTRHWSVYVAGTAALVIGLLAGVAAQLAAIVPVALLTSFVGLAVIEILVRSLRSAVEGPLILGPLFAFGIAASDLAILGLDSLFWALVGGLGVSFLLEREQWRTLTNTDPATD